MVLILARKLSHNVSGRGKRDANFDLRLVQVNIHLLIARVAFGGHDILYVIQERVQTFIDDQPCLLLGFLQFLVLILGGIVVLVDCFVSTVPRLRS